jgi:tetratricopeptide (TPR) repeat protein
MTSAEIYEVMSLCRTEYKENKNELKIISEFEKNYSPDEALKWYTRECFLYKMLSKAFRVQNIDLIFLFRFVIDHIQHQLKANKYLPSNRVYRGQLMTKEELKMLKESLGQFISINSFLSAILNENSARLFLVDQIVSDGIERVLFEIDIRNGDLAEFSDIKLKSYYTQEEILFSMGSIFQIIDIRLGKDGIQIIQMTLCSSDHPQIKPIFQYIENKYGDTKLPLLSFGKVLQKMNRFDEAEKYYRRLIKALPQNHEYIVKCQNALKTIPLDKDKHEKTLKTINESIDDLMETSKTKDFSQAFNHSHMGDNYRNMGQFDRALESYNTALQIWRKSFNDDHQEVGRCYNNIGLIYEKKEEYDAAVNYYQKALTILEKYLPANHSELGEIYFNIGHMHQYLNDDDQALVNYIKSLEIAEQTLIPQYSLVSVMNKIAFVYEQKKDFKEALIYYKKIAASLPSTHDDMVKNEQNIQRVSSQLK